MVFPNRCGKCGYFCSFYAAFKGNLRQRAPSMGVMRIILMKGKLYTFNNLVKIRILLLTTILAAAATVAQADPLTFSNVRALQDNGFTSVNLFNNSSATLTGTQLTFLIDVAGMLPPGGTDTLSVTFHDSQGGSVVQLFDIPVFGTENPPFTLFVTINVPTFSYVALPSTLTVDLLNSNPDFVIPTSQATANSYTYSFNVVQPVPEPATLALFGSGVPALWFRYRKKKKAAR